MGFNIAKDYVDRDEERKRFHQMRTEKTNDRILLILVSEEKGKSCLLSRLRYECEREAPSTPLALLDFDERSTLRDEISVAREIRRCYGDENVPHVCDCLDEIAHPAPPVHIQTGEGTSGVDFGRRGHFEDAEVSGVTGRDNITVSVGSVTGFSPTQEQRAAQKEKLGRALRDDLMELGKTNARAVILIDTFEQISGEVRTWLERWLFEPLCREVHNVMVVIAGRPNHPEYPSLHPYFEQAHRWSYLVSTIERFSPFTDDEMLDFFRKQGTAIDTSEHHLLDLARHNPAFMNLLADRLRQLPGGAR